MTISLESITFALSRGGDGRGAAALPKLGGRRFGGAYLLSRQDLQGLGGGPPPFAHSMEP
jgi:hypothetical protein